MCLKKSKFLKLLDDYPDAKRFYENRAIERRVEFRRVSAETILFCLLEIEETY
jgi:hypothetical protein